MLNQLAAGKTNAQIGARLVHLRGTVKSHLRHIIWTNWVRPPVPKLSRATAKANQGLSPPTQKVDPISRCGGSHILTPSVPRPPGPCPATES